MQVFVVFHTTEVNTGTIDDRIAVRTYYGVYSDKDYANHVAASLTDGEVEEDTLI